MASRMEAAKFFSYWFSSAKPLSISMGWLTSWTRKSLLAPSSATTAWRAFCGSRLMRLAVRAMRLTICSALSR